MINVVDAIGKQCPIPVVEANKIISTMTRPGTVEVHVDNYTAVENLKRLAKQVGGEFKSQELDAKHYVVTITVDKTAASDYKGVFTCNVAQGNIGDTVVAFDTDIMGRGSDELGATLMKGFIYGLSQLSVLPRICLFYNGGAKLTSEGSDSLEDLRSMEEAGVIILTCGTCVDYYNISDRVGVGTVTNMYDIVEKMNTALKIIKP